MAEECKVFSTKERAPFYICLELYRAEEEEELEYLKKHGKLTISKNHIWSYDKKIS